MARLRLRDRAQSDLDDIARYIARQSGSLRLAERFIDRILARCRQLASLPGTLGRARPELGAGIRSVVHRHYVIFFRYAGATLEVVRILEGHRDMEAAFEREAEDDPQG